MNKKLLTLAVITALSFGFNGCTDYTQGMNQLTNQLNTVNRQNTNSNWNYTVNRPSSNYRITNQYGQTQGYIKKSNWSGF